MPVLPKTAQAIDRYLRARRTLRKARTTDALWMGVQGRTFGYQGLAGALRGRAEKAGIEGFHLHRLRHTTASRWLAAGGSEDGLMKLMGWSDRNMIARYTHDTATRRALAEARRLNLEDM